MASFNEEATRARAPWARSPVRRALKRSIDLAISGSVLTVGAPVLALAALAVRTRMGSPVFFSQQRPGLRGHPFTVYKLRTMRDGPGSDEERLTSLGRFLRASSLDELPQLWNVLRGDMSLVGPRPLLMQYLARYTPEQSRRHEMPPGITGWAQVNGRNALTWEQKFSLDVYYVDHWSLRFDLEILARTALKVLVRDGISREGHATMPEFMGTVASS